MPHLVRPSWLEEADRLVGLAETVGPGNNPEILQWAQEEGGWIAQYYTKDEIPWCALFVDHCLRKVDLKSARTLAAGDYLTWGQPLAGPSLGAIVVLSRPGGHHVGFYLGQTRDTKRIRLRGGNQSDSVSDAWFDPARVLGYRWPGELPLPGVLPVLLAPDGAMSVSTNEA